MPRSIWTGAISFGLVNIPIKLATAVRSHDIRFNLIEPEEKARVRQQYVVESDGKEVDRGDLAKGYEIAPDTYVILEPEELQSIRPEATKTMELSDFVELREIDPVFFERPYYLLPGQGAAKAYRLLAQALEDAGKVGIATFVMRSREYLAAIRAVNGVLVLETMRFDDEVVAPADLEGIPGDEVDVTEKELSIAKQVIESLTTTFDPQAYKDTYRDAVMDLIEKKAEGEEIVISGPQPEEAVKVINLMDALEKSLEMAKKRKKKKSA